MTYGLGRKIEFDERSRLYSVGPLLAVELVSKEWPCASHLDQGSTPECVGFSMTQEINAEPVVPAVLLDDAYADGVYHDAQLVDEWPGENYDGTSVLAGAKVLKSRGWWGEYRWAFSLEDALGALSQLGPFVLGCNWYNDMFYPSADGTLHIGGGVAGGHAILANGIDVAASKVRLHNSWGPSWGLDGEAFLTFEDLGFLLQDQGEACIPLQRALVGPDTPPAPPEPGGCLPALARIIMRRHGRRG